MFGSLRLTLAELELAACSGLTGLLTLNLTGITSKESVLLQDWTILCVDLAQCASNTHTSSLSLTLDTATIEVDGYIKLLERVGNQQGLLYLIAQNFEREIYFESFVVNGDLTIAGLEEHTSHSCLTATYGIDNFHDLLSYLSSFNLIALGL